MGLRTLDAMAAGGIYDHLVGGFCRYSTDAHWLVPHFEKMLTDQAQLARAYLHAWQDGGRAEYLGVVTETMDFVLRDLSTPEGALYSSFDADAGGVEGAHATFTLDELRELLPTPLVEPAARWYGITPGGNWEGRSIPFRPVGAPLERPPDVEEARVLLAAARARRVQPARDEKVLTEWNAMTVATLAEVASATGRADYGRRAEEIGEFLWASMYADGRLMRSWQGGRARHLAVAADYAWLAEASFRLSEWTGRVVWRERAVQAAHQLIDLFWDDVVGRLLHDGPRRGGPGGPAQGVPRRSGPRGQLRRRRRPPARGRLRRRPPDGRGGRAHAVPGRAPPRTPPGRPGRPGRDGAHVERPPRDRPHRGPPGPARRMRGRWLPAAVVVWGEPDPGPLFEGRPPAPAQAYVCQGRACLMPASDATTLAGQLDTLVG